MKKKKVCMFGYIFVQLPFLKGSCKKKLGLRATDEEVRKY